MVETGYSGDVVLIDKTQPAQILQRLHQSRVRRQSSLRRRAGAGQHVLRARRPASTPASRSLHDETSPGDTLGTITVPVDPTRRAIYSPEGFGLDRATAASGFRCQQRQPGPHRFSRRTSSTSYFVGGSPIDAAVGPDGKIYVIDSHGLQRLVDELRSDDPGHRHLRLLGRFPLDLTWSAAGDLWVGDFDDGAEEFDSSRQPDQSASATPGRTAAEPALSGNVWDTNIFAGTGQSVHLRRQRDSPRRPSPCTSRAWRSWATCRTRRRCRRRSTRLLVRSRPGRERHDRHPEPERQERRVLAARRQRQRAGHEQPRRDQLHGRAEQLRRPDRRHLLRPGHRRPRRQVQPGRHPRRRLHHPAPHHARHRPGHHRDPAVGRQQAGRRAGLPPEPQRCDRSAPPSRASTSTARTAAACRRTPTRPSATASWPRPSTSSSASGTPPATSLLDEP